MISETDDHKALVRRFRSAGIFFEHPPLGGEDKAVRAHEAQMGAYTGSSDFRIYDQPPRYPECSGVAFELKRRGKPRGLPTYQADFLIRLACRGWIVSWGDIHDCIAWLRWLGYNL